MKRSGVCAPKGFRAAGLHCGIRKNQSKKDLALVMSDVPCTAAAVYTTNKVFGAPITVTRTNLANGTARAMLCNSGNANTCNSDGVEKANAMCQLLATEANISADDVIIASTGVIGEPLQLTPIVSAMPSLVATLSAEGGLSAAEAIMTTDLVSKQAEATFEANGVICTIGAMAKGSGMIAPNMATMLCFITTDAAIDAETLSKALHLVVSDTFNMLIVDGDTSTNDMVSILANGLAGNESIIEKSDAFDSFCAALHSICEQLTCMMAKDGEGASKLITCLVKGAPTTDIARAVARSVVQSPLCKTAMFGADANWGRILCAVGYTPGDFLIEPISVRIASAKGEVLVCQDGSGVSFSETEAKTILLEDEISVTIDLGQGQAKATAWGCDLTYGYVKINGDYRS